MFSFPFREEASALKLSLCLLKFCFSFKFSAVSILNELLAFLVLMFKLRNSLFKLLFVLMSRLLLVALDLINTSD